MAVVNFLTNMGLFRGQSKEFFATLIDLAEDVGAARRDCRSPQRKLRSSLVGMAATGHYAPGGLAYALAANLGVGDTASCWRVFRARDLSSHLPAYFPYVLP
ncbi:MAG: hypothetical protein ACRD8A_03790 [Candidatus Acidiferrales bacterium]